MRRSRARTGVDYWPAFVDALSGLLLIVIFALSVFVFSQFFLVFQVSDKDSALTELELQIAELSELLVLERKVGERLTDQLLSFTTIFDDPDADADAGAAASIGSEFVVDDEDKSDVELTAERQKLLRTQQQLAILNQNITALSRQIEQLERALALSEQSDEDSQVKLAELGKRLNLALVRRIEELSLYRSDFLGELSKLLGEREDIIVEGDRFSLPVDLLFEGGAQQLSDDALAQIDLIAQVVLDLEGSIPADLPWVIRVDGHTDTRPVVGFQRYRSNWELSSQRALVVVERMVEQGVDPKRLLVSGFGENHPIDLSEGDEADARNRRIELKLTLR